jgi:hypothetical protein
MERIVEGSRVIIKQDIHVLAFHPHIKACILQTDRTFFSMLFLFLPSIYRKFTINDN